jgi:hypothetical protein
MKSQLFIGKRVKAHNHRCPDHLVGTHSFCPCILFFNLSLVEILKNIVTNGRSIINELADDLQLHFLGMTIESSLGGPVLSNVVIDGYLILNPFSKLG